MAQIVWTRRALNHLRVISDDSVVRFSPAHADRLRARILAAANLLVDFPLIGSVVSEYNREYLRERLVKPFRVIYAVRGDTCTIVGVIHASRDLTAVLTVDETDLLPDDPSKS